MQVIAEGFKDSRQKEHPDFQIHCPNTVGAQGIAPGRTAVRPYSHGADNCIIHWIDEHKYFFNKLMGAGTAGGKLDELARGFLETAIAYLQNTPKSKINAVYFLAWDTRERDACLADPDNMDEIEVIV